MRNNRPYRTDLWQIAAFAALFVLLAAAYIPSRIRTAVTHPMLAAVKLWAFAHLLVRGDLASASGSG